MFKKSGTIGSITKTLTIKTDNTTILVDGINELNKAVHPKYGRRFR